MEHNKKAVLKTLLYSDIFDYPLNYDELWRFLISGSSIDKASFDNTLKELLQQNSIVRQESFYCLPKREMIIDKRKRQRVYVEKKLAIAKRVSTYLSFIPTIFFVGVSGNVAAGNAQKNDDIDFFIVAREHTIWTTRFLVLVVLEILRRRRRREQKNVSDTICVNMMIDQKELQMPSDRRDLFSAYEIALVKPVFEREGAYNQFIGANMWARRFMPNSISTKLQSYKVAKLQSNFSTTQFLAPFEFTAKKLQLWLINKHRTTETVSDSLIAFHPTDYRKKTLAEFSKRLEIYDEI